MADTTQVIRIVVDSSGAQAGGRVVKRSLDDIKGSADAAQQSLNGLGRAGSGLDSLHRSAQQAEGGIGRLRGSIANLGFQIQDAAVQLQGGTNALVVLAQQGSQAASAFGPLGAIIGTVIALGATAAGVIFGLSNKMGEAKTAANDYAEAMKVAAAASKSLAEGSGVATKALEAERRNVIALRDAVVEKALAEVAAAQASAQAANIQATSGAPEIGLAGDEFQRSADVLNKKYKELRSELMLLKGTYGEFNDGARDHIRAIETSGKAVDDHGKQVEEYNDSLRTTVQTLGLTVDYYAASDAAKLRAKLTSEALTKQGVAEYAQLGEGTKALIEQAVAYQTKIDALKEATKAGKTDAAAHEAGIDAAEDYIAKIRGEAEGLGMTDRARAIYAAGLEVERIAKGRLNDDETAKYIEQARKEAGAMYDVKQAHDEAKKASEEYKRAVEKTTDDVVKYSADAFADMIGNGKKSWKDLFNTIERWAVQTAARIAAEMIIRPIVQPVVASMVGAAPGLFGVSQAGASTLTGGQSATGSTGGILDLFSGGSKLFTAGNGSLSPGLDAWAQSTFGFGQIGLSAAGAGYGSVAGGAAAKLGVAAIPDGVVNAAAGAPGLLNGGSALAGFGSMSNVLGIAGAVLPGLMSGNYVQAGMGGLGAAIGTAILPGVGTMIGGMLGNLGGGLFGGKKAPKTEASAYTMIGDGGGVIDSGSASRNQDTGAVQSVTQAVTSAVQALVLAGGTMSKASIDVRSVNGGAMEAWINGFGGQRLSASDDPNVLVKEFVRAISANRYDGGDIVPGDPTLKLSGIGRRAAGTASSTGEDYIRTVALAEQVAAATAGMKDFDKSLNGVAAAAQKAATEGFKPLLAELEKAKDGGFATEYRDLISGQMKSTLDQMKNPADWTALETAMAQATGQMEAMRIASDDLGLGMRDAIDAAEAAVKSRLLKQAETEIQRSINAAAGEDWRNSLDDIIQAMEINKRQLAALGGDQTRAEALATAQVKSLIDQMDTATATAAVETLTGALRTMAGDLLAAKVATDAAAQAQEAAALAAEAAAEAARQQQVAFTRSMDAQSLAARASTVLGRDYRSSMMNVDATAFSQLQGAISSGGDVGGLIWTLMGERAKAQIDGVVTQIDKQIAALEQQTSATTQETEARKSLGAALKQQTASLLTDPNLSPLSQFDRLTEATKQFQEALALAREGDKTAAGRLDALGRTAIEAGKSYYASTDNSVFAMVQAGLLEIAGNFETQRDHEDYSLKTAMDSLAALRKLREDAVSALGTNTQSIDGLRSELNSGISALTTAVLGIKGSGVAGTSGGGVGSEMMRAIFSSSTTQTGLSGSANINGVTVDANRLADIARAAGYTGMFGGGQLGQATAADAALNARIISAVQTFGAASAAGLIGKIPGFADGGVSYGAQVAMVSEGRYSAEAHVPLPDGRSIPVVLSNDNAMVAELRALRQEVRALRAVTAAGAMQVTGAVQQGNANTADMAATSRREAAAPKVA